MKRLCKSIELDEKLKGLFIDLLNDLHGSGVPFRRKILFYVDEVNEKDIKEKLIKKENKNRFRIILATIIEGKKRHDLYGPEEISSKAKGVKAMKFTGGDRKNLRIYCKEYSIPGGSRIVMANAYYKKSQKVNKELRENLEIIGGYEYEF